MLPKLLREAGWVGSRRGSGCLDTILGHQRASHPQARLFRVHLDLRKLSLVTVEAATCPPASALMAAAVECQEGQGGGPGLVNEWLEQ